MLIIFVGPRQGVVLRTAGAQQKIVGEQSSTFPFFVLCYFSCPSHRNGVESPNFECESIEPGQLSIEPGQLSIEPGQLQAYKVPNVFLTRIMNEETFLSCT
tara:strand:+ start:605 stop:907 length:303 start_codon:yes stop_codon:yes gene_type:complete